MCASLSLILFLVGRVFINGLEHHGLFLSRVIPKTQKMVCDTSLLNTQHYKVYIKGKVEQSRERSSAPPLHLGVVAIEKGVFGSPIYFYYIYIYIYTHVTFLFTIVMALKIQCKKKFV